MNDINIKYSKITLVKSTIGVKPRHKLCVYALGLKKTNSSSRVLDNAANRGLIRKVSYLLKIED